MDCFGYTLHMSKPNVTRVQSATEWTASVHTLHMSQPNVTCVQSATEWTDFFVAAADRAQGIVGPRGTTCQRGDEYSRKGAIKCRKQGFFAK